MRLLFSLLYLLPIFLYAQPCKEVVGYYPSWQWYDRNKLMNPQSVLYDKYTIINYSFFKPLPDGNITISDPWADKNQLLGPINWSTAPAGYDTQYDFGNVDYHLPNQKMSDYVHQGGCKMLISIGGWTYSGDFPVIAADPAKRAIFAHNCNTMVKLYNLDGIDIDWEYPVFNDGSNEHTGTPADKQNYTIFLQQIRDSLETIETQMNRQLLLTAAVAASPTNMTNVEWANVVNILDIINLMSYDFYGAWDNVTNHNSPLYPSASNAQLGFSCSEAVDNLLGYGVPANKITMGVAWYGRSQMTVGAPGIYVAGNGQVDGTHFSADAGSPLYYNILAAMNDFDYHWDSAAEVPYLTGKTTNAFLSYDDEASIEKKAQFINLRNLRGAIIWEISGDYIENPNTPGLISSAPLTDMLNTTFCSGNVGVEKSKNLSVSIYPNPANTQLGIYLKEKTSGKVQICITDIHGKNLKNTDFEGMDYTRLEVGEFPQGIYFLHIIAGDKSFSSKWIKL